MIDDANRNVCTEEKKEKLKLMSYIFIFLHVSLNDQNPKVFQGEKKISLKNK